MQKEVLLIIHEQKFKRNTFLIRAIAKNVHLEKETGRGEGLYLHINSIKKAKALFVKSVFIV